MLCGLDKAYPELRKEELDISEYRILRWYYKEEEGGALFVEATCKDGSLHGPYRIFRRDGSLAVEYLFQKGKMVEN